MELEAYLSEHGLTLPQVSRRLADALGVRAGEVVFLSGSLVSGLGNLQSDIDGFIVTSRALDHATVGDVFVLPLGDTRIDVEWWRPATVEALFRRVEDAVGAGGRRDPRPAMLFTRRELEFLYRLRIGRPLSAAAGFDALVARLQPEWLTRMRLDRARVLAAALQTDIAGFLQAGDEGSAFLVAHELVGVVADAFLAGHGEMNPAPKWRLRALASVATRPGHLGLPARFGGPRMVDAFLGFWTRSHADAGLADYAWQAVMLSNLVMPWAQRQLDSCELVGAPIEGRPAPSIPLVGEGGAGMGDVVEGPAPADRTLGRLATRARVVWTETGLHLHVPGEGHAIGIGPVTHRALAYFDGRTTAVEAAHRLAATVGITPSQLRRPLLDLHVVLLGCGYLE